MASVFSVIRNTSVPYGTSTESFPNLSTTPWRVVADQKNLRYFFETAITPNTFWVDLNNVDFSEGTGARVLRLSNGEAYAGKVSDAFVDSEPFQFQGI